MPPGDKSPAPPSSGPCRAPFVAVGLVDLRLHNTARMCRVFDTDHWQSLLRQGALKSHCDRGPASSPIRLKR